MVLDDGGDMVYIGHMTKTWTQKIDSDLVYRSRSGIRSVVVTAKGRVLVFDGARLLAEVATINDGIAVADA